MKKHQTSTPNPIRQQKALRRSPAAHSETLEHQERERLVGQHPTERVYEKVVDVESDLPDHHKSTATKAHFDVEIKGLEDPIKKLPVKEDPGHL
ncbi:hypothetical protein [Streptomyces sp. JW3]|uniref:hypothetical protein n=1 Tax=Streptomyces sp. JW3 TaxID=3456955 RepID=UPI003FA45506